MSRRDESLNIYFMARRYRDEDEAKRMFEWMMHEQRDDRQRRLGVYRARRKDGDADVIAVVSFGKEGIEWATRVMDGESYDDFSEDEVEMMVNRRLSAIMGLTLVGAPTGTYRVEGEP